MYKAIFAILISLLFSVSGKAQDLKKISFVVKTDSLSYISMSERKVFTGSAAFAHKQQLHLALVPSGDAAAKTLEWYNLSGKDDKLPKQVLGTAIKISAISFDREQFDKCKTAADLKRMTGYLTSNSLSHFAVVRNSAHYYQRCFIFELKDGKRGLMYITEQENNSLKVDVKIE